MSQAMMGALKLHRVLHEGDGILVAEIGKVCVALWRKDSTMERFRIQKVGLTDFVRQHPGAGFLCVVESTSGVPGEDVRKASSELFASLGTDLRAIAMVIEGTGFRSAIVRSVASGIVLLMGKRATPISYFSNVDAAAQWLQDQVEGCVVGRLVHGVKEMRADLKPS